MPQSAADNLPETYRDAPAGCQQPPGGVPGASGGCRQPFFPSGRASTDYDYPVGGFPGPPGAAFFLRVAGARVAA